MNISQKFFQNWTLHTLFPILTHTTPGGLMISKNYFNSGSGIRVFKNSTRYNEISMLNRIKKLKHLFLIHRFFRYIMFMKSWPILYNNLPYEMSQDFLDGQYPLKSLFQSYTVSHYIKMSKTYWTHSTLIFFTLHSKNSSGRVTSSYLNQMVTQKWMRMCCKLTPDRLSFISIDITLHEISFLSSLF